MKVPHDVRGDGAFRHFVPFGVPGFRGLEPKLGLSYSSHGKLQGGSAGIVAQGWLLSGLSMIERRSVGGGVPSYDNTRDIFVLDGRELMACADGDATSPWQHDYPDAYKTDQKSASCLAGGQFAARVESSRKITRTGAPGTANSGFTVWRPDGTQMIYRSIGELAGVSASAAGDDFKVAFQRKWLLTEIRDAQDTPNVVKITYGFDSLADAYAPWPETVEYAGYAVKLHYTMDAAQARKAATGTQYFERTSRVLRSVSVKDGSRQIRAYGLEYASSPVLGLRRLAAVQEYGSDFTMSGGVITGGSTLPGPFSSAAYESDVPGYTTHTFSGEMFLRYSAFADFDGDGRTEMLRAHSANRKLHLEDNYNGPTVYTENLFGLLNVKEDGGTFSLEQSAASRNYLNTYSTPGYSRCKTYFVGASYVPLPYSSLAGAFLAQEHAQNGHSEGRGDYSCYSGHKYLRQVRLQDGAVISQLDLGQGARHTLPRLTGNFLPGKEVEFLSYTQYTNWVFDFFVQAASSGLRKIGHPARNYSNGLVGTILAAGDFDGDGLTEILSGRRDGDSDWSLTSFSADEWEFHDVETPDFRDFVAFPITADVNGDSAEDIVFEFNRHIYVQLSSGSDFLPPEIWLSANSSKVNNSDDTGILGIQDVNGDGLKDLIVRNGVGSFARTKKINRDDRVYYTLAFGSPTAHVLLSTGIGFMRPEDSGIPSIPGYIGLGDFDGDGLTDFVQEGKNGTIHFGAGSPGSLLTGFTGSLGARTTVAYMPSTAGDNNNNRVPFISQLVDSISVDNGRGQTRTTRFSYTNQKYDYDNRKSLGFGSVTAHLPAIEGESEGPQVVTVYLNDHFAQKGRIKSQTRIQGGVTYTQVINDWSAVDPSRNGPHRSYLTGTRTRLRHGTELIETARTYSWSDYGARTRTTDLGFTSGGTDLDASDTVSTIRFFTPNAAKYIVRQPYEQRVVQGLNNTSNRALWLSSEEYLYEGNGTAQAAANSTNLTEKRIWNGAVIGTLTRAVVHKYAYDARGNLTKHTTPRGHSTTYAYDSSKHLFRVSETNALGHTTATAWDMGCQAPDTVTGINGLVTDYTYDSHCRETYASLPGGDYVDTSYSGLGDPGTQFIGKTSRSPSTAPGQDTRWTREYFDGFGESYRTVSTGATSALDDGIATLRAYDARGNLSWESIPVSWTESVNASNISTGEKTRFTYDPLDRLLETTEANGHRTTAAYTYETVSSIKHPQVISTDHDCTLGMNQNLCHVVKRTSDARGNVIRQQMTDTDGSDAGASGGTRLTQYRFDLMNRLTGVTDPGGAIWAYTHDVHGNRLSADDPGLGYWTMEYDANGNLTRQTDANSQVIAFTYDALDRVTRKDVTWSNGGSSRTDTTAMTYDTATGWLTSTGKNKGFLTAVKNAAVSTYYRYNDAGQPYWERHDVAGAGSYDVARTYHPSGELLRAELPKGTGQGRAATPDYLYDAAGRVIQFGSYVTNVTYNLRGQPERMDFGSGVYTSNDYQNQTGWLNSTRVYNASNAYIDRRHYYRHPSGRVNRQYSDYARSRLNYCYDYTGRLLVSADLDKAGLNCTTVGSWTGSEAQDQFFSYRPDGSMASNDHIGSYSYAGSPVAHAPASVAGQAFTYDANGNMTKGLDGKVMTYDGENRPLSVSLDGNTTQYVYGADGTRLQRIETVDGQTTTTLYAGGVEIVNPGAADEEVHWYPHENLRLSYANGSFKEVKYLHRDQLGSVFAITGANGLSDTRRGFAPFGDELETVSDAAMASYPAKEDTGFIGEREDEAAGLMYLNARYYDPELAGFIPADPALEPANTNAAPAPAKAATQ